MRQNQYAEAVKDTAQNVYLQMLEHKSHRMIVTAGFDDGTRVSLGQTEVLHLLRSSFLDNLQSGRTPTFQKPKQDGLWN